MKQIIKACLVIFLLSNMTYACKTDKNNLQKNSSLNMKNETTLKDGIDNHKSFITDIHYKKYQYEGGYIEDLSIKDLLDKNYRQKFYRFLSSRNFEAKQYEQIFFIKLLLARTEQVADISTYLLLEEVFLDENLVYYLEDYELELFQLFLYKPEFFIKGTVKTQKPELLNYINENLPPAFLTNKTYFESNISDINFQKDVIVVDEEVVRGFALSNLKKEIETQCEKIEVSLSPSFETEWKSEDILYYNIKDWLDFKITNNLSSSEITFYNVRYKPFFKKYLIKANKKLSFQIQDPDGYTNLRKDKNAQSEILQQVKSGEHIEVLDNSGDWFLVKTQEGNEGYIHKSRIIFK